MMLESSEKSSFQGTIGGLSKYYGFEPTWAKVIFVLALFGLGALGSFLLLGYIVLSLTMPDYDSRFDLEIINEDT